MSIITKWLSRKVIITIGTAIIEILIATGTVPVAMKTLLMKLIGFAGSFYVLVEGIADIVSRIKKTEY